MCSIFPFQNDLLCCSFGIQGLFNKIPVLFLQIQGVFKEEVISKEFSRPEQFFLAHANHGVALDFAWLMLSNLAPIFYHDSTE